VDRAKEGIVSKTKRLTRPSDSLEKLGIINRQLDEAKRNPDAPLPTSCGAEDDEPVPYRLTVEADGLANAPDPVNHPPHYTSSPARCECGRQIECIDVTRHLNFNRGNVIKYVWRAGSKGDEVEDLEKAMWYLRDEIARVKGERR
jgi:hypothetical protein